MILLPLTVSSQDYILRNGKEVYKYDKNSRRWSSPLPSRTPLYKGDSIISNTTFTLETPSTFWDFLISRQRSFTYPPCEKGIILNDRNLKRLGEVHFKSQGVSTQVGTLGDERAKIEHLAWILQDTTALSIKDVELDLYMRDSLKGSWTALSNNSIVSISTPVHMAIFNNEPYAVFTYVFWKDVLWDYFFNSVDSCQMIFGFSYYDLFEKTNHHIKFREPLGKQKVVVICSKDIISADEIELLISGLNNNRIATIHHDEYDCTIGFDVKNFILEK